VVLQAFCFFVLINSGIMKVEFVPYASYFKATLIQLYNNEGEVKWDSRKLRKEIESKPELLESLKEIGYHKDSKGFTTEQIILIFTHISHPILNKPNMELLKLKPTVLLDHFEQHPPNFVPMKMIKDLTPVTLCDLGLRRNWNADENPHYTFEGNANIYLLIKGNGFEFHNRLNFEKLEYVETVKELIEALLKYKNNA
jgi:hypothetical protein